MRTLAEKDFMYPPPLGSAAAAIRSFLLSVSPPPFGIKNSIEIIIFPQIRENEEFFSKKSFFNILGERGRVEIFGPKIFLRNTQSCFVKILKI